MGFLEDLNLSVFLPRHRSMSGWPQQWPLEGSKFTQSGEQLCLSLYWCQKDLVRPAALPIKVCFSFADTRSPLTEAFSTFTEPLLLFGKLYKIGRKKVKSLSGIRTKCLKVWFRITEQSPYYHFFFWALRVYAVSHWASKLITISNSWTQCRHY